MTGPGAMIVNVSPELSPGELIFCVVSESCDARDIGLSASIQADPVVYSTSDLSRCMQYHSSKLA